MDEVMDKELFDSIFKKTEDTICEGENEFQEYDFDTKDFMQSVGLFGTSMSGKTFFAKYLLSRIKHLIPRVILFSPTAQINGDFKNIIHDLLIIPDLTEDKFIEVIKAQTDIAELYRKVNNIDTLKEVFNVAATNTQKNLYEKINNTKQSVINNIMKSNAQNIAAQKIQQLEDSLNDTIINFMKYVILPVRHTLDLEEFSEEGKQCIKYLDLNPRVLLIFDDNMEEIKEIMAKKKSEASMLFKNIFTKGRHYYISFWIINQDDTSVVPCLRKNIMTSVFTTSAVANSYITRASNGISKDDQKIGLSLVGQIFQGKTDFRKIIYLKEKSGVERFKYYTASNPGLFISSSSVINSFCDSLLKI